MPELHQILTFAVITFQCPTNTHLQVTLYQIRFKKLLLKVCSVTDLRVAVVYSHQESKWCLKSLNDQVILVLRKLRQMVLPISRRKPHSGDHQTIQTSGSLLSPRDTSLEDSLLSVAVSSIGASVITPIEVLRAIWKKASELLHESKSVVIAPGHGEKSRIVRSYSGSRPHLVTRKKNGQYACDSNCPNWRSLSICAHSVAAAEDNSELHLFVKWFVTTKWVPNITKLTTTEMPVGRGRKGTRAPPKKRKKTESDSRIPFSSVAHVKTSDKATTLNLSSTFLTSNESSATSASNTEHTSNDKPSLSIRSPTVTDTHCTYASCSNLIMTGGQLNLHSPDVTYHNLPIAPPPLIHCSPHSQDSSPFTLVFIGGNIRVCRGCRQPYLKPARSPLDLCVRHNIDLLMLINFIIGPHFYWNSNVTLYMIVVGYTRASAGVLPGADPEGGPGGQWTPPRLCNIAFHPIKLM